MKLPKAIEILTYWKEDLNAWNEADTDTAIKLGIEALKFTKSARDRLPDYFARLLPGETDD